MLRYMIDTDISSYIMKRSHPEVLARLSHALIDTMCISVITRCELEFGAEISTRSAASKSAIVSYLQDMSVLSYPETAASHYAQIRAMLKQKGLMIGPNDLLIAAHARSLGLTLVTNNIREFSRVEGLRLENWTQPTTS